MASFIPLLSAYACAIPPSWHAHIENKRDASHDSCRTLHDLLGAPARVSAAHRRFHSQYVFPPRVVGLRTLVMLGLYLADLSPPSPLRACSRAHLEIQ